jgi:release factor glutamine methyltransferase
MPDVAARTGAAVVAEGAAELTAAGIRDARREAASLWAGVTGQSASHAWLAREQPARPSDVEAYSRAVQRRAAGEPLAYVTGRAGFRTLELHVDRRVLIPRPETEGLVERVLTFAARGARWGRVADIGTGSGCIALSLAVEGRFRDIVATDLSSDALEVARANAATLGLAERVTFRAGDLLEPIAEGGFDVIVSNPPYVTEAEYAALDPGVRDFEPRLALVSGAEGLASTTALLDGARALLADGGLLAIEVDSERAAQALAYARAGAWADMCIEHDLFGRTRYLLATT